MKIGDKVKIVVEGTITRFSNPDGLRAEVEFKQKDFPYPRQLWFEKTEIIAADTAPPTSNKSEAQPTADFSSIFDNIFGKPEPESSTSCICKDCGATANYRGTATQINKAAREFYGTHSHPERRQERNNKWTGTGLR